MKFSRNKAKVTAISFVLVLTFSAILVALPTVVAHDPPMTSNTWTYCTIAPNPIGAGQRVLVVFWLDTLPQTATGAYGDRYTFTVEVTKPDNSKQTLGPFTSDPVGGGWASYTPDQLGTYTFVAKFPGLTYTGEPAPPGGHSSRYAAYIGDTLLASTSDPAELVVQQDPIKEFEGIPLPTDYWTRPIYATNREWSVIAGSWLSDGTPNPWTTGPETAHIVWTRPATFGGIVGGDFGANSYHTGSAYEGFAATDWRGGRLSSLVINGRLYYSEPKAPRYGW